MLDLIVKHFAFPLTLFLFISECEINELRNNRFTDIFVAAER